MPMGRQAGAKENNGTFPTAEAPCSMQSHAVNGRAEHQDRALRTPICLRKQVMTAAGKHKTKARTKPSKSALSGIAFSAKRHTQDVFGWKLPTIRSVPQRPKASTKALNKAVQPLNSCQRTGSTPKTRTTQAMENNATPAQNITEHKNRSSCSIHACNFTRYCFMFSLQQRFSSGRLRFQLFSNREDFGTCAIRNSI